VTLCPCATRPWLQVLADRGESGSKFGRATFSVLLLQDLAVVVLLMLIPLLAPSPDGATGERQRMGDRALIDSTVPRNQQCAIGYRASSPPPPLPILLPAAGVASIAKAIGAAAVKAVVTMVGITVAGRTLLRPLYKRVAGAATAAAIPVGSACFVTATPDAGPAAETPNASPICSLGALLQRPMTAPSSTR
jgi:predicted Kef-type K+ transport protein